MHESTMLKEKDKKGYGNGEWHLFICTCKFSYVMEALVQHVDMDLSMFNSRLSRGYEIEFGYGFVYVQL